MTFDPEQNRIPTGLLTDEERAALEAAKHGWQVGSDEDDSPTGYGATRIEAQAAAQSHADAAHWANTVIGSETA